MPASVCLDRRNALADKLPVAPRLLPLALCALLTSTALAQEQPVYKDPSQPVDRRVADLISRMTVEEKVAQMMCLWQDKNLLLDEDGRFVDEQAAAA